MRVLLVEDDPGDAFLVGELLDEADAPVTLRTVPTMAEALADLHHVDCVLLDLGLPDASGLDGLRHLLRAGTGVAICVLTGLADEHLGMAAVAEGAQDYLVKGRVDGILLSRAIRYAVERRRADENALRLREAELRQAESARLERGLLPQPLMEPGIAVLETFYRPGRQRALLGGDFYDAVQTGPARLALLVGDVCGHGAEEAALGVALRVAWRALTLARVPEDDLIPALERVLMTERRSEEVFATMATVTVDVAADEASVRMCGHPPPLLISGDTVRPVAGNPAMMLGVLPGMESRPSRVPLPGDWAILVYTDGLIEGRVGDGRLGVAGLCRLVSAHRRTGAPLADLPGWLFAQAEERNGDPLADDVAMLLLTRDGAQ
ncbi:MAG: transcriptional regulator [Actinobacteria bacterium 13_2_20CM_2_71_6]|nr:MAG: transcriptional regulator [Actinobacteria bacterium 13_2_20CM_2_71_6]